MIDRAVRDALDASIEAARVDRSRQLHARIRELAEEVRDERFLDLRLSLSVHTIGEESHLDLESNRRRPHDVVRV